jgi:hypothetical protein
MPQAKADYDTPWKDVLEQFFEPFMRFYFPDAHAQIDWEAGFIFKDKELQKVTRRAKIGRLTVDKLVQVCLKSGLELWVLIHIEVQSQHDADFEKRVFVSNYRLFDGQDKPVASLVILSDTSSEWRPSEYGYSVFGSHMQLRFPSVKLLDYREQAAALEKDTNPFAVVTLTHLKAIETKGKNKVRYNWKRRLFRSLYQRGWKAEQIRHLYDFIDWVVDLPEELDDKLWEEMREYEEEINMPYVNSAERYGIKKGIAKGITKGRREHAVELAVRLASHKLGKLSVEIEVQIKRLSLRKLDQLALALFSFTSMDDLAGWLQTQHS